MTTTSKAGDKVADDVLRTVGIDPRRLAPVLDLAALGLVNLTWRTTVGERWHAEGRIHDGDMLRVNAYSTWRLRQLLARWRDEVGLGPDDPLSALDQLRLSQFMWLGGRIHRWVVNPDRRLPDGRTVLDLAGAGLPDLGRDVDRAVTGLVAQAQHHGIGYAVRKVTAHGGLACRPWWGHPAWPDTVTRFLRALNDPADAHWGLNEELRLRLTPEPLMIQNRRALERVLREAPWRLDAESARWVVSAGIKHARPGAQATRPGSPRRLPR